MMNPRLSALKVLLELEQTPKRLERILNQELDRFPQAQARDRAFTSNLVYGVLRNRIYLDHLLGPYIKRGLDSLDPEVLGMLRLGAYELAVLKNKPYAVVNAVVGAAKKSKAKRAQGLINAVLRKLGDKKTPDSLPKLEQNPVEHLSLAYSHPVWLVREMLSGWEPGFVRDWCAADQMEPLPSLRANTMKISPDELRARLEPLADKVESHPLCPESLVLHGVRGPAAGLPGFEEGLWQMQDPAASALSLLLGVEPGMRVLDMCAGAGGKTGHLAALMANEGELAAVEPSAGRFKALKQNLARLGASNALCLQTSGQKLPKDLPGFDRILIDAPCTALGVIRRRPDVRYRRGPEDPDRLAELQYALLEAAAGLLNPGGVILYCTCSITRRENQAVAEKAMKVLGLESAWPPDLAQALRACLEPDGFFRTYPHLNRSDAFFAARLKKP